MYGTFIVATAVITLMPGPSLVIILMFAIRQGLAKAIQTILGVVLADALLLTLVLSGLGALLYSSALAFITLKWLGAAYLIWLGIAQLRSKVDAITGAADKPGAAFTQGFATTILNPKIIGFLIVYFPQFLQRDKPVLEQMRVLGPLFLLVVFLVFLGCALVAKHLRGVLDTRRGQWAINNGAGASLIGCGLYSALT